MPLPPQHALSDCLPLFQKWKIQRTYTQIIFFEWPKSAQHTGYPKRKQIQVWNIKAELQNELIFTVGIYVFIGPGSVVGIATAYGPDSPGIKSRWCEIFRTSPDQPWGPPSLLYNGYWVFPRSKVQPGRDADPLLLLVQRSKI